jgi:hypothetical protein
LVVSGFAAAFFLSGQPGVGMVALTVLDIEDLVDILAFIQSLPAK